MPEYIRKIESARLRVRDVARLTPLETAAQLSERLGNQVLLKREDLQPVFSFKLRGAYNKIAGLSQQRLAGGVIAASAGNHAQGVALAAARRGVRAVIVMPVTTPDIKVSAVAARRAEVVLHGDTYEEAAVEARRLGKLHGLVAIPPYDDSEIIAGQATVATEICEQCDEHLDAVFVPCGGGGLLAGMALWLHHMRPRTRVYGVEPDDAACLAAAMKADRRVTLPEVGLFAEGAAVGQIGREPFRILRQPGLLAGVVTVSSDEICAAIKDIFEETRSLAEPAGALALAGLKRQAARSRWKNRRLLAVHSGANINFNRLRYIAERTELGEEQEALFSISIPERPGSFLEFCRALGQHNITEFNYRFAGGRDAQIFVGVATEPGERTALRRMLRTSGYRLHDMSDNEMAKLHVRYMVGGRAEVADEVIFRVQFAERPGALLRFLERIAGRWNITLFHYRSHGAAIGRVLVGFQVPVAERAGFAEYIRGFCLLCEEESANRAYLDFLRHDRR